jgi:RNA polymerase sigma factor (sigma-70 family)
VIGDVTAVDAHRAVEAVWRIEAPRIIAGLSRMLGDVGLAEEFTQDALVAALEQWPESGVPPNPGAWLTVIAKRRAIDRLRRAGRLDSKLDQIGHDLASRQAAGDDMADAVDDVDDDLLRLVFICCHPVLSTESQVALALRLLGGLTTTEIARAFLSPESTVAQRIVRAKRTLSERRIPFEVPPAGERAARLSSVLGVIYLIFNEGYAATAGDDWMRPALCQEALRLGRFLAGIAPGEAEVHGLVALMEIQASRTAARTDPSGTPIPLLEQNRGRWDQLLIRRGFAALLRAEPPPGAAGPYVLQAAIAACHAQARTAQDTDWVQIASLYEALDRLTPSPVVRLNHAVAIAMVEGPATGLDRVDALAREPALKDYPLLSSVRGDLLARLGRHAEARAEFERAAALVSNARVRAFVLARAAECAREAALHPAR